MFPRGIGDLLAIDFPDYGTQATKQIQLMGHAWPAVTATVNLLLRPFHDMGWAAEIDFVLEEGLPFGLLGYEGFLNRWAVSFNGYQGYVVVEPTDEFDDRQPPEVFEILRREWPELFG